MSVTYYPIGVRWSKVVEEYNDDWDIILDDGPFSDCVQLSKESDGYKGFYKSIDVYSSAIDNILEERESLGQIIDVFEKIFWGHSGKDQLMDHRELGDIYGIETSINSENVNAFSAIFNQFNEADSRMEDHNIKFVKDYQSIFQEAAREELSIIIVVT